MKDIFEALGKPFAASDVSWRLQYVDSQKLEGFAVPYLDARAIADRLDEVVGQFRWKDEYTPWHNYVTDKEQKPAQLCTIYIYDEDLKEWIGKTDGAEDSDMEPVKGGLSDAFKRAAVRWNIGRYLYGFQPVWVKAKQRGKSYVIESSEEEKLNQAYNNTVAQMFGTAPAANPKPVQKPNTPQNTAAPQVSNAKPQNAPLYEIKSIKVKQGTSGENSAVVVETGGQQYQAYISGRDDRLQVGSKITNVKVEKKSNSYGSYNLIQAYDMAA